MIDEPLTKSVLLPTLVWHLGPHERPGVRPVPIALERTAGVRRLLHCARVVERALDWVTRESTAQEQITLQQHCSFIFQSSSAGRGNKILALNSHDPEVHDCDSNRCSAGGIGP